MANRITNGTCVEWQDESQSQNYQNVCFDPPKFSILVTNVFLDAGSRIGAASKCGGDGGKDFRTLFKKVRNLILLLCRALSVWPREIQQIS